MAVHQTSNQNRQQGAVHISFIYYISNAEVGPLWMEELRLEHVSIGSLEFLLCIANDQTTRIFMHKIKERIM